MESKYRTSKVKLNTLFQLTIAFVPLAPQYGASAFVILIIFSNLAVILFKGLPAGRQATPEASGQASFGNSIPIAIGTSTAQMRDR